MKVMLYIRPNARNFFTAVANKLFSRPLTIAYSDYRGLGEYWAGKYIYSKKYEYYNEEFEKEAHDIIPRCRTLRNMKPNLAYSLALRYWNGMEEFFQQHNFDYLICTPVDCYSLDIICRIAKKHGVHLISITGSPFYNHAKITSRGEYNLVRKDVSDEEAIEYISSMTKAKYLSPSEIKNVTKTHLSIYKWYFRRKLIEKVYYPLRKIIDRDPWNYHYNIFDLKGIRFKDIFDNKFEKRFKKLNDIEFNAETTIYYPMHLVPEDTTDYWCSDIKVSKYEEFVISIIENADPGINLIIKEHPAMYGRRRLVFYDRLNSYNNVILLHPMDRSNELLLRVNNVVVDNGTVGIEALLRGKRVLALSDNYYCNFHPNSIRCERVTWDALNKPLVQYDNKLFMKDLLRGCFYSNFSNSNTGIPASNVNQVVDGFRSYIINSGWPLN